MVLKQGMAALLMALLMSSLPAYSQYYGENPNNGFTLSQNPYGSTSSVNANNEDIALRGHLSTIPQGTIMMIRIDQPISSYSANVGDPVSAVVESDVFVNNQLAIPAGSNVMGTVSGVEKAGKLRNHGELEIHFNMVRTPNGYTIPLRAHIVTSDNSGIIKGDTEQAQVLKTLGTAVGTTAAGTLMGTAAGGLLGSVGGGATFGLAAGGLAGLTYAILKEGKQVVIPSGARMSIVLDQPVSIN